MTRLNVVLLLAVLASAIYLVHTQYESRRLFTELDRAVAEARRLETEHQRLQVEKRAQATPLRVEKIARAQLNMRTATPAITQYVSDPQGVAAATAAAAASSAPSRAEFRSCHFQSLHCASVASGNSSARRARKSTRGRLVHACTECVS